MWIVDTGATSHITYNRTGGVNLPNMTVKTRGFAGQSINPDLEMNIPVMYICDKSKEIEAELKDVQVNEKFNFNLFSITQMHQKGYILKGDANLIRLCKGNHEFKFDSVIQTHRGALYCARFCRHSTPPPQEYNVASVVLDTSDNTSSGIEAEEALKKIFKINGKQAHEYLGHLSKDTTRIMAKYLGMIFLRGLLPVCKWRRNWWGIL